ncbi:MAG: adenylate kinase family protein [Candidatus Methanofastidiosa archaeon]|nr:adenylate kinase family protein [Candidatus Methanofastidiosa archaeon]
MRIGISGTPGSGKTTIAKAVSKNLNYFHADISKLAFENKWILERDLERDTSVIDIEMALEYLSDYENIVIDSHYAEQFDCDIIIVVRCPPVKLFSRLSSRRYKMEKIKENLLSEILDTCLINAIDELGEDLVYEIETGDIDPIVSFITDLVARKRQGKLERQPKRIRYLNEKNLDFLNSL